MVLEQVLNCLKLAVFLPPRRSTSQTFSVLGEFFAVVIVEFVAKVAEDFS